MQIGTKKVDDYMVMKDMTKIESREDAKGILEQFSRQRFLAEIDEVPELSEKGRITNLDEFKKLKYKKGFQSGTNNPVHNLYIVAPKATSVILEAIDEMDTEPAIKKALFDVYIAETKDINQVDEDTLNEALEAFLEVYKGDELEGPDRKSVV